MTPAGHNERAFYPAYSDDFVPETPEHERQVRYLRDSLGVLLAGLRCEVTGNNCLLGWDGQETLYAAPDLLAYYEEYRTFQPLPPNPHPNPHPGEQGRRFELAVDVTGRCIFPNRECLLEAAAMPFFGLGAYVRYDVERRSVEAFRLVDRHPLPVMADSSGRLALADLDLAFGVDDEGFLRVYDWAGQPMPRYEDAVRSELAPRQRASLF